MFKLNQRGNSMSKKAADTASSVGAVIAIEQHFPRDAQP